MHLIEEVFGSGCDLYEVLGSCPRDADKAVLRKSYYRAALEFHPDRNPNDPSAHKKFQAISLAYQILKDADLRAEYDETGAIPSDEVVDDNDETKKEGVDQWKAYFDQIFGKVTATEIEAFCSKYKCSDEEKRDVLKEFKARQGNLIKMLDYVMLSEPRDALRWVEDFLRPAMESGELDKAYQSTMEKTLKQCQAKVDKENAKGAAANLMDDDQEESDDEETESEEESASPQKKRSRNGTPASKASQGKSKASPKKARPTQAKRAASKTPDMSALVSAIQNKNRGGGGGASVLASLGARYGVSMEDDDDPLVNAAFARVSSKLSRRMKKKSR